MPPQRLNMSSTERSAPRSAMSALTCSVATTTNAGTPERRRVEERSNISLFQLSNVPSPLQEINHKEFEEAHDARCYEENPGASDSEDEPDVEAVVDDDNPVHPSHSDKMIRAETNDSAELNGFVDVKIKKEKDQTVPWCHGAPIGWKPPGVPDDWAAKPQNEKKGEPKFEDVDNPGDWPRYVHAPKFKKTGGTHVNHSLPTGTVPVPVNADTQKRTVGDWEFHYRGWKKEATDASFRDGCTKGNMFPQHRAGSLDQNRLMSLGLNEQRMKNLDGNPDALFFYQLLLPIHQIHKDKGPLPVENDCRKPFYADVAKFTNLYAVGELELGSGYGHHFETTSAQELLQWDGVLVMDGVRGGSKGAIFRQFDNYAGSKSHDKEITRAFTKTRWLELKRCVKLCNNLTSPKKGQEGYNPAYKYDMIFATIIHNVNALTLYANPDLCGDETSMGSESFGEAGSGLLFRVIGKPGITKGMQTVLVSDVDWIRPRAYLHRHKLHPKLYSNRGPTEVRLIWETQLGPLCDPMNPLIGRALFQTKPHMTWDNYFSGDDIMNYAADEGFGLTMTCRRDRLPGNVPKEHFHHKKVQVALTTKAARFQQPVVAVKRRGQSVMALTTFQSTSSCNFVSVNAINDCDLYALTKKKGRGSMKREWAIEMNQARDLYLNTHGVIDRIDHLIKNCAMKYRSWKYWHAAMTHAKALAVVVACDMYLECCTGNLVPAWKTAPATFYRFREVLAKQMLSCSPTKREYPGDERMRACTQQSKKNRVASAASVNTSFSSVTSSSDYTTDSGINSNSLSHASGRLCGFLDELLEHEKAMKTIDNRGHQVCRCCGKPAYTYCSKCPGNPAIHVRACDGKNNSCFLHYHNTSSFGKWKEDFKYTGTKRKDWTYPDEIELQEHGKQMKRLHLSIQTKSNKPTSETTMATADIRNDPTYNDNCI